MVPIRERMVRYHKAIVIQPMSQPAKVAGVVVEGAYKCRVIANHRQPVFERSVPLWHSLEWTA